MPLAMAPSRSKSSLVGQIQTSLLAVALISLLPLVASSDTYGGLPTNTQWWQGEGARQRTKAFDPQTSWWATVSGSDQDDWKNHFCTDGVTQCPLHQFCCNCRRPITLRSGFDVEGEGMERREGMSKAGVKMCGCC